MSRVQNFFHSHDELHIQGLWCKNVFSWLNWDIFWFYSLCNKLKLVKRTILWGVIFFLVCQSWRTQTVGCAGEAVTSGSSFSGPFPSIDRCIPQRTKRDIQEVNIALSASLFTPSASPSSLHRLCSVYSAKAQITLLSPQTGSGYCLWEITTVHYKEGNPGLDVNKASAMWSTPPLQSVFKQGLALGRCKSLDIACDQLNQKLSISHIHSIHRLKQSPHNPDDKSCLMLHDDAMWPFNNAMQTLVCSCKSLCNQSQHNNRLEEKQCRFPLGPQLNHTKWQQEEK